MLPLGIVLIGVMFSFGTAVVPHFDSAHRLLALPFGLGVSLYGIYGVVAALVPSELADRLGLKLLGIHVVMVVLLRVSIDPRMLSGWLALVPAILILYMLADLYLRRHEAASS
jgi:hypothetical protein